MRTRYGLIVILAALVVGCNGPSKTAGGNGPAAAGGFRAGMVTDVAGVNDKSFNASAWEGMQRAKKDFGITTKVVETKAAADYAANLQALATQNYDIVFAVGFSLKDALEQVAPQYPKIKFAIIDGDAPNLPNCVALKFKEQEGSYLVGYLAGAMSKSGKLGFIGGMTGPLIKKFEAGFVAGVKTANPKATIDIKYVGDWNNVGKAKELALTEFAAGTDIIYQAAGLAGVGVIQAAAEKGEGFYAIGVDRDQDDVAPGRVLTSMVKQVGNAVYDAVKRAKDGHFEPGTLMYGTKENGVGPSEMKFTKSKIDPKILENMGKLREMIVSGVLTPPSTDKESASFIPPVLAK